MALTLKQEFIQDYGEAYHRNGLPTLMGRIVGLLLYSSEPITLDEITIQLNVSKGPVSQVMRRLRDHNLIQRIWIPGDRKDYYQAEVDIFGNAFKNQLSLIKKNLELASKYRNRLIESPDPDLDSFSERVNEMTDFYELMKKHFTQFQVEWLDKKNSN